jgi:CheY-like chemotaxis protein/HPt (histidine-containing phosphotransfer) domain-containing protein
MLMTLQNNSMEYDSINTNMAPPPMSKFVKITNESADDKAEFNASVLVVEDDIVNQDVAQLLLEALGCRIALARNGIEAVKMAKIEPYDLILMDCQMPEMDGFEATRLIREQEKNADSGKGRHVTVIALTGGSTKVNFENCKMFGMDDYLGKPFNVEQLRDILAKWLPDGKREEISGERMSPVVTAVCTLDEKQLNSIRSLQREGAPDILEKVVNHYFSEAPCFIRRLREAVLDNEAGVIRSTAHSFKTSSANLGAQRLADFCREMESFGLNNEMSRTSEVLEKIEEEYVAVSAALAAVRQGDKK